MTPRPSEPSITALNRLDREIDRKATIDERLAALYLRALQLGWTVVQVDRATEPEEPTLLHLGCAEDDHTFALEIDERWLPGDTHFRRLLARLGSIGQPWDKPSEPRVWLDDDPMETLALEYLRAWDAGQRARAIGEQLLRRMAHVGVESVRVEGLGTVVREPARSRQDVDKVAAQARLDELVAALRALGREVPDAVVPTKRTPISAFLKVTPAISAA